MIEKIEIQYFRSIYKASLYGINEINIITGKNDVGKSNVLRALNLFFNNCVVEPNDFVFLENYNLKRLDEVRKDTIKGKQFIQIKITFIRGDSSENTLPDKFTVTKKWNRDSIIPIVTDDVDARLLKQGKKANGRTRASITRFLNKYRFVYVPAIKDQQIFGRLLSELQEEVYVKKLRSDAKLNSSMKELALQVSDATKLLSEEFFCATNVESSIETPTDISQLYTSLKIMTHNGDNQVPLKNRGDGIQVRYLPSIINYLATNSNNRFIWGFEEPENSLEFNLARRMAEDFYESYRKNSTIFVTTHSPAFIDLANKKFGMGYRCYIKEDSTSVTTFEDESTIEILAEELGYAYILQKQYEEYKAKKIEIEKQNCIIHELKESIRVSHRPVLLTEGKTDAAIIKCAWDKLYDGKECPFDVKSCSLTEGEQETAGCSVLASILKAVRYDSERVVIGLFDNDDAGQKAYELDKNFRSNADLSCKVSSNKKAYAMMLPTFTEELKRIADCKALCIEFMFDRNDLEKEVEGKGLVINRPIKTIIIGNQTINKEEADPEYWYLGKIDASTKTIFADYIVPSLAKESFHNFVQLFAMINRIISSHETEKVHCEKNENTIVTEVVMNFQSTEFTNSTIEKI